MSAQTVIDSLEFARAEEQLQGRLPVRTLPRLQDFLFDAGGEIEYRVRGGHDEERRPVLILTVSGLVHLRCQRCLGRLDYALQLTNTLRLVREGESPAGTLIDPEAADCVEASATLDVEGLVEDEILLSLPLSPRHEDRRCEAQQGSPARDGDNSRPFAGLAELKRNQEHKL